MGFLLGVVVKSDQKHRVTAVSQQAKEGTLAEIVTRIEATGGTMIHTAYVERLNATFRSRLAGLVRRGRCLLRQERRLRARMYLVGSVYNFCTTNNTTSRNSTPQMYLVGSVYNFCTPHRRLRAEQPSGTGCKWRPQCPALAAGLTDHVWTVSEWLHFLVAPTRPNPDRLRGKDRKGAIPSPRKRTPRPITV